MGLSILGFTIGGLVALALLMIGLIGLVGKKAWGQSVRGVLGMIPIGNPKLWAAVILIVGLAAGGLSVGYGYVAGLGSGISTASLGADNVEVVSQAALVSCRFISAPTEVNATAACTTAASFRADTKNVNNYFADIDYTCGTSSVNGTLLCTSNRADIRQGAKSTCYIKGDSFRSETSTTDSNTYFILASSASASLVPGMSWQQTAYLADSGTTATAATTSSQKEKVELVFAQDEVEQYLGYYATLPGATIFGYLNNQTSNNLHFICDGNEVATLGITKTA